MRVIRMEHRDTHEGPFQSKRTPEGFMRRYYLNGGDWMDPWAEPNVEDFPTPTYELHHVEADVEAQFIRVAGERSDNPDLLFATRDEAQFEHWFDAHQRHLAARAGFVKAVYDVPDDWAAPLSKQVAFRRSHASLVAALPLEG